ncbi:hypothetical protein LSH36_810g00014 [Paralvinella palmiformis]|uniref:Uncharacterized protein n=1 Tax=Paralvinella palmiformis TaxID=53620 RepID=A0AAD9J1B5_9ANNE|nr:hypothetical protein LSH36_810g00014 [Paralvinella palmiformis]
MAGMCQLLRCGDLIHVIRVVCQKCKKNRKYGVFFVFALTTGISFGYFMSTHRLSDERIMRNKEITHLLEMLPVLSTTEESCGEIFSNNTEAIKRARNTIINESIDLLAITNNCQEFKGRRGYVTETISSVEEDFPLAYSILMYKDPEQVERLLRAIYRPHNIHCIHVDASSEERTNAIMLAISNCLDNVFLASKPINVQWGSFSVVDAELLCMKQLLQRSRKWKYLINLTGQEFPLKTNLDIVRILKVMNGSNMVSASTQPLDVTRWRSHLPAPGNVSLHKGSTHALLTRAFVQYLLYNKTAKDFARWLRKTNFPDESLVPSLNHSPQLQVPGAYTGVPKTGVDGYRFIARFKIWYRACNGKLVRNVCVFGVGDLPKMPRSHHLFANKFYFNLEPMTLRCLEELHYNKTREDITGAGFSRLNMTFYNNLPNIKRHIPSGLETSDEGRTRKTS